MDDPIQDLKKLQRRQRDAAEMLWGDGRLRESLPDEQAEALLDWAVRFVKSRLNVTVEMPDKAAEEYFDALITAVRRLLIQMNQLVVDLPKLDEAEANTQVNRFLNCLDELTGRDTTEARFDFLGPERQTWQKADIFQRIMDILTAESEEE
jgi:hypothetical protein